MSDANDSTEALIERLREQCPSLVSLDEAWFHEPIDNYSEQVPAAYVYLAEDGADDEPNQLARRQSVTQTYGVWLVAPRGADFRACRQEIRTALFGWQPPGQDDLLAYRGGQMSQIIGAYMFWREFWTLETLYRARGPVTI